MNKSRFAGHQLRVHPLESDGNIIDRNATVEEDEGRKTKIWRDNQFQLNPSLDDLTIDILSDQPISHWQVWEISQGDRLMKDEFGTFFQAESFAKQQQEKAHWKSARRDEYVPPVQFEVRAVPVSSKDDTN
ncbi:hypothetical protein C7B76_27785 [filamentous cyanobacterium CCP2]|nr:hypothetical protein C7B76_27785 [filamentous cyanobacterium CCP2]